MQPNGHDRSHKTMSGICQSPTVLPPNNVLLPGYPSYISPTPLSPSVDRQELPVRSSVLFGPRLPRRTRTVSHARGERASLGYCHAPSIPLTNRNGRQSEDYQRVVTLQCTHVDWRPKDSISQLDEDEKHTLYEHRQNIRHQRTRTRENGGGSDPYCRDDTRHRERDWQPDTYDQDRYDGSGFIRFDDHDFSYQFHGQNAPESGRQPLGHNAERPLYWYQDHGGNSCPCETHVCGQYDAHREVQHPHHSIQPRPEAYRCDDSCYYHQTSGPSQPQRSLEQYPASDEGVQPRTAIPARPTPIYPPGILVKRLEKLAEHEVNT